VPLRELLLSLVFDDVAWVEKCALRRHAEAEALTRTTEELERALALSPSTARETKLAELDKRLRGHAKRASDAAIPGFADATLNGLLRRFWCKELIGEAEKLKLKRAIDAFHRVDPLDDMPLPATMRRVLLDERNAVLAARLRSEPGDCVVGVVGKGHLPGIAAVWDDANLDSHRDSALQLPAPPVGSYVLGAAVATAIPAGLVRSPRFRKAFGIGTLALGAGATWLVAALKDRLAFFERSQRELAVQSSSYNRQSPA
jgi:hypothetical protein